MEEYKNIEKFGANGILHSSKNSEWRTPWWLINFLNEQKKIYLDLDVCATRDNKKAKYYISPDENGLDKSWWGTCWMNPPYGNGIDKWVKKAFEESREDNVDKVICLLPSRTDNAWWHTYVSRARVWFLRGRINFKLPPIHVEVAGRNQIFVGGFIYHCSNVSETSVTDTIPVVNAGSLDKPKFVREENFKDSAPFPSAIAIFDKKDTIPKTEYIDIRKYKSND